MKTVSELPLDLYFDPKKNPEFDGEVVIELDIFGPLLYKYWDKVKGLERDDALKKAVELGIQDKVIAPIKRFEIVD